MPGQFPGGKYLDDLNPEEFTEEQKQALIRLRDTDPYTLYNLFRDPDAAQRMIEGDDFQTTPADELFTKIGALKLAGAPYNVVKWWQTILEHRGRKDEPNTLGLVAKTKVIEDKMHQIENFCKHIDEELNYVRQNYLDETDDFMEDLPTAAKWQNVMNRVYGIPETTEIHKGTVRHYKAEDHVLASSGTEIVEIILTGPDIEVDLESYADDVFDDVVEGHINPYAVEIKHHSDSVTILFKFADIYE